jgi:hypothetical protein
MVNLKGCAQQRSQLIVHNSTLNKNAHPSQGTGQFPAVPPLLIPLGDSLGSDSRMIDLAISSPCNAGAASQTTKAIYWPVPLGGSGGNFSRVPPGGGFSRCPAPPCRFLRSNLSSRLTFLRQCLLGRIQLMFTIIRKSDCLSRRD